MRRAAVTLLSALPFLVLGNAAAALENATIEPVPDNDEITISLRNYQENQIYKRQVNLIASNEVTITVIDIPSNFWFIVLQIHVFHYHVTLSYDKTLLGKISNRSLFGSNIGLYLNIHNATVPTQVFLKHENIHNTDMLLVVIPYTQNAPIPGGCNMEFETEVAPYQKLDITNQMIIVDMQPASALAANGLPLSCEKNLVQHKMYRLYLPKHDYSSDTYFKAIKSMLTVQDIELNGVEIPSSFLYPSMRRVYSEYVGTGSVYAAIATYGNYSSAYIPTFTYACNPLDPETCQILNDTLVKVILALALFIGLLSIIIGHKYGNADCILPSCVIGSFVGYAFAEATSGLAIHILVGLAFAVCSGCVSMYLHRRMNERPLCALLCNLPLGFLCGCITYLYAPAWTFHILQNDWLFWPAFLSLMLTVAVILKMMPNIGSMITRAVFGSYLLFIAIDYYSGTNLKYILITLIRRITISSFHSAFVYPPYQGTDAAIIICWIIVVIIKCIKIGRAHLGGSKSFAEEETQNLLPNHNIIYGRYKDYYSLYRYRSYI